MSFNKCLFLILICSNLTGCLGKVSVNKLARDLASAKALPAAPTLDYSNPSDASGLSGNFSSGFIGRLGQVMSLIPLNVGGQTIASCVVSPSLPAGLSISSTDCGISGMPSALSSMSTYTVTASNSIGSGSASFSLSIIAGVPTLSYSLSTGTFVTPGSAMSVAPSSIANNGAAITSCVATPSLASQGLAIDANTCAITGTTSMTPFSQTYSVVATNSTGNSVAANVTLTTQPLAPSLSYAASTGRTVTFGASFAVSPSTFNTNGAALSSCTSSPSLPSGVSINASTCAITGISATAQTAAYTISAVNSAGTTTASVTLVVNVGTPVLTYSTPVTLTAGALATLTPTTANAAGGTLNCSGVSPALPAGLSLNSSTCVISGTPTTTQVATGYTVTVSNGTNSSTGAINLTVNPGAASASTSTINGSSPVSANGTATSTITILLRDSNSNVIAGVTPTFSATNTGGTNAYGACSATNASGVSTCTLRSSNAETKVLQLLTPASTAGGSVVFYTPLAGAPASVTAADDSPVSQTQFVANWSAVTGAVDYQVSLDNSTWTTVGAVLTYKFTGLTSNTTYIAYVRARDYTLTAGASNSASGIRLSAYDRYWNGSAFTACTIGQYAPGGISSACSACSTVLPSNSAFNSSGNGLATGCGWACNVDYDGVPSASNPTSCSWNPAPMGCFPTLQTFSGRYRRNSCAVTGAVSYEYSENGGTSWTSNGASVLVDISSLPVPSSIQFRLRGVDSVGNKSYISDTIDFTLCNNDEYSPSLGTCTSCVTGEYARAGYRPSCTACSNKSANSNYTGMGGGLNACPFLCSNFSSAGDGYYRTPSGSATAGTCTAVAFGAGASFGGALAPEGTPASSFSNPCAAGRVKCTTQGCSGGLRQLMMCTSTAGSEGTSWTSTSACGTGACL